MKEDLKGSWGLPSKMHWGVLSQHFINFVNWTLGARNPRLRFGYCVDNTLQF